MYNWNSENIERNGYLEKFENWNGSSMKMLASLCHASFTLFLSLSGSFSGSSAKCVSSHTMVAFSWLLFGTGPIHNSSCIHRCRRWSPAHSAARAPPPPCCPSWLVGRSVPWCTWYSIHFSPSVIMCVTWFSSTALYTGRIRGSGLSQMPWHHF